MEWKWTKGEPYERSRRKHNNDSNAGNDVVANNNDNPVVDTSNTNKGIEFSAYSSSLNYDENTWDILNQEVANGGFKSSNKREDLDVKIADRHLVQQRGFNPFLSENEYADDVSIRDQYLKPQNTTQDMPK
jgi:SOS response regulatory protein OraA/RecX